MLETFMNSEAESRFVQPNRTEESNPELVSLARLKEVVWRLLPPTSMTRGVILAEKDSLPLQEAISKFEVFDRLLTKEFAQSLVS